MSFLLLALVLIVIGVSVVIIRNRRPRGIDSGIAEFEARRDALAPNDDPPRSRSRRSG